MIVPKLLPLIHPGEHLFEDFMQPLGISRNALARELRVPPQRISEIVKGRRGISADTALRLGRHFNTSPEFWITLQTKFDLRSTMEVVGPELRLVRARRVAA